MEHTMENALIAGILLSVIIIPFFVITQKSKKQRKVALAARLTDLADKTNCQITQSDLLDTKAIGLDENSQTILFIDTNEENNLIIDLTEISTCNLLKKIDSSAINSIQLHIKDKNDKLLHVVPFYKRFADNESHLSIVAKTAEKWRLLIERTINEHKSLAINGIRS
ncbi:MAG TPA: hypothetical protein VGN20_26120 [Mucilaginibacter sp.]|jgi:hypothetical protein